ncbi:hypothetical protein [Nonomuraea sp. NPDC002799]
MIKAEPGFVATFKSTDGTLRTMDVVAWDDEGRALVLDGRRGELVDARSYGDLRDVTHKRDPYISAVPGQGWLIEVTEQDGKTWTHPVIAFAIDLDGYGTVVAGAGDGSVEVERDLNGDTRKLIPPGGWQDPWSLAK